MGVRGIKQRPSEKYGRWYLTSNQLCTVPVLGQHHGECKGDSGGPLISTEGGYASVIGVVSFGDKSCEGSLYTTVYAR